jgi:hypothetical protein
MAGLRRPSRETNQVSNPERIKLSELELHGIYEDRGLRKVYRLGTTLNT